MQTTFLSYARADAALIDVLARDLRALGFHVWFDTELSAGSEWWSNILVEIERCEVFVYCLSNDSIESAACQAEFGYARALNRFVLPVQISSSLNGATLRRDIALLHRIDYQSADKAAVLALARALLERGPGRPLPEVMPAKPPPPLSYLGELREQIDEKFLDFEKQSSLLLRIKELVRAGRLAECKELVVRFRKRHDIYAIVAEEIDVALGTFKTEASLLSSRLAAEPPVKWVKRLGLHGARDAGSQPTPQDEKEATVALDDLQAGTYALLKEKYDDPCLMRSLSIEADGDRYLYRNYSFAELSVAVDFAIKRLPPKQGT